jgi:hypothetical protein
MTLSEKSKIVFIILGGLYVLTTLSLLIAGGACTYSRMWISNFNVCQDVFATGLIFALILMMYIFWKIIEWIYNKHPLTNTRRVVNDRPVLRVTRTNYT